MSPGTVATMEGVTPSPSSSSQSDAGEVMETRFTDLRKRLDLDESLTSQGMTLFKERRTISSANISSIGSGSPEEVERIWFAFVLYCVTKLGKSNQGGGRIKLFRILREAKLNAVDFCKEMPQFSLKAGHMLSGQYSSNWERRLELKELQARVDQLNHLSRLHEVGGSILVNSQLYANYA